jgi:hypothetical protein
LQTAGLHSVKELTQKIIGQEVKANARIDEPDAGERSGKEQDSIATDAPSETWEGSFWIEPSGF